MTDLRQIRLPDRETAIARGWTHQVQWMDGVLPCFSRVTSGAEADDKADALKKRGCDPQVIDLRDALQIH